MDITEAIKFEFHLLYERWKLKPYKIGPKEQSVVAFISLPTINFLLEIAHDSLMKHVSFILKMDRSTPTVGTESVVTNFMDLFNAEKDVIYENEKTKRNVDIIRIVLEDIHTCFFPTSTHDFELMNQVGKPLMNILKLRKEWITNPRFSVACYGKFDLNVEFEVFDEGNTSDIPSRTFFKSIDVFTYSTIVELRYQIQTTGVFEDTYTIGSFYTEYNGNEVIYDDESQYLGLILEPADTKSSSDIKCMVVYGQEILM